MLNIRADRIMQYPIPWYTLQVDPNRLLYLAVILLFNRPTTVYGSTYLLILDKAKTTLFSQGKIRSTKRHLLFFFFPFLPLRDILRV